MEPSDEELETKASLGEEEVFLSMLKKNDNEVTVRKVRIEEIEIKSELWSKNGYRRMQK